MTTGNREDYLIAILRLTEDGTAAKTTELAEHMGVSPASVSEMLKILSKDGLVEYAKYRGVRLTEKGYRDARLTRKRHHIVEKFFIDVLGLEPEIAHMEAHRIEHTISDSAAQRICDILGNPPDCDCQSCVNPCKSVSGFGISITFQLCDVEAGFCGSVAYLKTDDSKVMEKLMSMGIIPGREISVTGRDDEKGVITAAIGGSSVALDRKMASYVYLDRQSE